MSKPAIVEAIVELAAEAKPAEPEQLDLSLPPTRFEPGSAAHDELVAHIKRDRIGRPRGSRNLVTRDALKLGRQVAGDPILESVRWLQHTPATLAAELGCTKLEAWDRLEKIRADLRPYYYARQAPVDGEGNAVLPSFTMVIGGRSSAANDQPPWIYEGGPAIEQNQQLSEAEPDVSHGDVSHGEPK
jgi:hypothetical protein